MAVSSSQQTSPLVGQLLLPEHASVSPVQEPLVTQLLPMRVAQQTCVKESQGPVAPHAI